MAMLMAAEHLCRYCGRFCAVNDVSFTLAKGEVPGFLGPNGAGITTAMQMLCGNLALNAGRATLKLTLPSFLNKLASKFILRQGFAEKIALITFAVAFTQILSLLNGFHAFGYY